MNWDDVRYFLAVCREGSVKRAGALLGVSHTTVLRRMNSLEKSADVQLFERTRAGYAMTQAAEEVFAHAVKMETQFLAIDRKLYGQNSALKGTVRVTVPFGVGTELIVNELPRFLKRYPEIDLILLETMDKLNLGAREAELAIRLTPHPPEYLIGRRVQPLVQGIYGTREYMDSAEGTPHVILYRGEETSSGWVGDNFPGARVSLRTDNPRTMHLAALSGVGVARLPCFLADNQPKLRRVECKLEDDGWGIWLLTHPDFRTTPRVRVCREFLATIFEENRDLLLGERSNYL